MLFIYIDIKKAFDSVNHRILLAKLKSLAISISVLNWITAFLSNRKQYVKIADSISPPTNVISGVPQGSVLGPILFLCYINDLPNVLVDSKVLLFADDAKIYLRFPSSQSNSKLLQDMHKVLDWTKSRYLEISFPKCSILHIGQPENESNLVFPDFIIPKVSLVKDLGIWMSSDLKFAYHIEKICKSANQMVNLIFLCFSSRDSKFLLHMFKTFVLSKIEYCSEVWSPYLKKDIIKLEQVQRRFTKRLPGVQNLSYEERLHVFKLRSFGRPQTEGGFEICIQNISWFSCNKH